MIAFSAHFDGKVIVPEHAVDLPRDRPFVVHVETPGGADSAGGRALPCVRFGGLPIMPLKTTCLATFPPKTITTFTERLSEADSVFSVLADTAFRIALFRVRDQYRHDALA